MAVLVKVALMFLLVTISIRGLDSESSDRGDAQNTTGDDQVKIPGEFLIRMKSGVSVNSATNYAMVKRLQTVAGVREVRYYRIGHINFFFMRADGSLSVAEVAKMADVAYIEPNGIVRASCTEQEMSLMWGLDRIDQRDPLPYNLANIDKATYIHSTSGAGEGVDVYVIDTGINILDPQFESRATHGYTASDINEGAADMSGHGTHVAGTIGAKHYGVAKKASLIAVKVLDKKGQGTNFGVMEGMQWTMDTHSRKKNQTGKWPKTVINMSLGGFYSQALNEAVEELVREGITVVVAAGNDDINACYNSPASADGAITVGSVGIRDMTSSFTNWGSCVDIFAPGEVIYSVNASTGEPLSLQGTSMAAPHVAGVVARYMGQEDEAPTPESIAEELFHKATKDAVVFRYVEHEQSPNRLLYVDCGVLDLDPYTGGLDPYTGGGVRMDSLSMCIFGFTGLIVLLNVGFNNMS